MPNSYSDIKGVKLVNIIMEIIELNMNESDIVRAIKNTKYNPIHYLAVRQFRELLDNIDVQYSGILIWDDETNDYTHYKYCNDDIDLVTNFLESWNDFTQEKLEEFNEPLISFCVEKLK